MCVPISSLCVSMGIFVYFQIESGVFEGGGVVVQCSALHDGPNLTGRDTVPYIISKVHIGLGSVQIFTFGFP